MSDLHKREVLDKDFNGFALFSRRRVPGGWIYILAHCGVAFVPDHNEWDRAIEEAVKVITARIALWKQHGGAQMASPYSHLTVEGELDVIEKQIRAIPKPKQ